MLNPQLGQVAARRSDSRVVWAECLIQYAKRAFEERFGIDVATLDKVQRGQVVERLGDDRAVGGDS